LPRGSTVVVLHHVTVKKEVNAREERRNGEYKQGLRKASAGRRRAGNARAVSVVTSNLQGYYRIDSELDD
jgi:hypothetical protein